MSNMFPLLLVAALVFFIPVFAWVSLFVIVVFQEYYAFGVGYKIPENFL